MSQNSANSAEEFLANLRLAFQGHALWQIRKRILEVEDALQCFLHHVACTVPFYSDFGKRVKSQFLLREFPIVSRRLLGDRTDSFVSDVFREEKERFFAHSYGTTEAPLRVGFDRASWYDFNYGTYDYLLRRLPHLNGKFAPGVAGVSLITNMPNKEPTAVILPNLKACLFRRLLVGKTSDEDLDTVRELRERPPVILYGKGTYLLLLKDLDETLGGVTRIRPQALLASGECLYDDHRRTLEDWFAAPLINAYISTEGGLMAADCLSRMGLHIYEDRILLELEDTNGTVSMTGTGQLLLTNLSNWATAFVRYRMGDVGSISTGKCSCGFNGRTITTLTGRDASVYRISTGEIQSGTISTALENLPLRNYQFSETSPQSFRLIWVPSRPASDPDAMSLLLRTTLQPLLGECTLDVKMVESVTQAGGKLRRFVSISD